MSPHILCIGTTQENSIIRQEVSKKMNMTFTFEEKTALQPGFNYDEYTSVLIQESCSEAYLNLENEIKPLPVILIFNRLSESLINRAISKNIYDYVVADPEKLYLIFLAGKLQKATQYYLLSKVVLHKDEELATTHVKNEENFKFFLDNLPLPVRIFRKKTGKNIFINQKFSQVYGYSLEDIPDNDILYKKAYPEKEYREQVTEIYNSQIDGSAESPGDFDRQSVLVTCKDGTVKDVLFKAVSVDENILLLSRDISNRLVVEKALKESEERMSKVVSHIPVLMSAFDDQGNVIFWNKEAEKVTGYTFEDILADPEGVLYNIFTPELYRLMMNDLDDKTPEYHNWEMEITKKDGEKRIIAWSNITCTMSIPGWHTFLFGFDITEQKQAQEALKYSEEKYRTIIEHANDGILIMKEDEIVNCNKRAIRMLDSSYEEVIGASLFDFAPIIQPDGRKTEDVGFKYIRQAMKDVPLNFEWMMSTPEGQTFYTEISLYSIHIPDVDLVAIIHDISKRKDAVLALRMSERKYRLLIENQTDYITKVDRDGKYQFVSPSYCKLLGVTEKELIGKHVYSYLKSYTYRKDIDEVLTGFMKLFNPPARMDVESRTVSPDGIKWVSWTGRSVVNEKGDFDFIITVGRDITEKKKAEEEALIKERQLIQSEKMASLGVLISGIAHEINNPNNYILLNSKIIQKIWHQVRPILDEHYKKDKSLVILNMPYPELKEQLVHIYTGLISGADRIKNIVNSLKEFSQPDLGIWNQDVDVNTAIESSLLICNTIIKKSTDNLELHLDKKIPYLKGSLQQLEQVIINLIINACQALDNTDQKIKISSQYDKESESVIITVSDEGKGISENDLHKIFDPFYTTKTETGGTGLGLSISYNIIKKFKGTIQFSSVENQGTTARLILPIMKDEGIDDGNLS